MRISFSGDELVLAIIALVRRINPAMLNAEGDGFSVDFALLAGKTEFTADEHLLIKLRSLSESNATESDLDAPEARALGMALERLELLQAWPKDVVRMSRGLRSRLSGSV